MKKNNDLGLLIMRVSVGFLMLLHGIGKLKGIGFVEDMFTVKGLPGFLANGIYITEIVMPILMIIGYRTRLASIVFATGVLVAIFLVHASDILKLNQYGGWEIELLGLFLFGAVALIFTGAGKYAVSTKSQWD